MAEEKKAQEKNEKDFATFDSKGTAIVVEGREGPTNHQKFRQSIVEHGVGVLPKHSFIVNFGGPGPGLLSVLGNYADWGAENLLFRCESAQLPGVTALKEEIRRFGYGPIEEVAYGMQFQDMTLGFIVSRNSFQFKFFNEWMNYVTNFRSYGGSNMTVQDLKTGMAPYEVSYKQDYTMAQSNIFVYDRAETQTMVYEIYDLFPIAINATDVSWGDADQLMRLYVRFAYTDYTLRTPQLPVVPSADELERAEAKAAQERADRKKKKKSSGTSASETGPATAYYNADGMFNASDPAKAKTGTDSKVTQSRLNTYTQSNNGYVPTTPEVKNLA